MQAPEIDVAQAQGLLESAVFVDVRDPSAYHGGRVPGATWIHDGNVRSFTQSADKSKPLVVYCYKGNASKGGALHFLEQGFTDVKSLTGGFEAWKAAGAPTESGAPSSEAPAGFTIGDLAKTKLEGYLASESKETRVRITAERSGWGLALDEATGGDVTFESAGVGFVVQEEVLAHLAGLQIGFVEKASQAGFTFEGAEPPGPPGKAEMLEDIKTRIAGNKVMVFMKGTADAPRCGFSARVVDALRSTGKPFGDKNVLEIPEYRYVLSEHSEWPTIPQIFIDGEFVGGCDILMDLKASGELQKMVDAAYA